jgi:GrpB-like predicted nucleotidyltransferase (UPF0157 family)
MVLEKYTPDWISDFMDIKSEIEKTLGENLFDIEHIGSTSVPNLDSKPIIDIDIIFSDTDDFVKIKSGLEKMGYYHNGDQGIKDREVFKRNGKYPNEILDTVSHHLYVCHAMSQALERHILSRNFLRKNDWARIRYQEMKYEMAEKANQDRKRYQELKELHINSYIDSMIEMEKTNRQQDWSVQPRKT